MTTRLILYNDALLLAGERKLSALTEDVEARHLLDLIYNNKGVDACLAEAQWNFAMRTVKIDYDTALTPSFGFTRAFTKPSDWIRTAALCSDEFFLAPVTRYFDEAGYWYTDIDAIYMRYVSNASLYGGNIGSWPKPFEDFVAAHFAAMLILKTSGDPDKVRLFMNPDNPKHSIRGRALANAQNHNAMGSAPQFIAPGNWTQARQRGFSRSDGGNTSSLTG